MNKNKLKKWLGYWAAVAAGFFVLTFILTSTWIGVSVKEKCLVAQGQYQGDCVEALIKTLDDDSQSYKLRNDSIWALGQLGDSRAQEVLEKYYTGDIPSREPYNDTLSQYEMKKALNLVKGGFNVTHLIWNEKAL